MGNIKADGPVGVLDSGLGGLTVVQAIWRHLPQEHVLYVGDTARVPYGGREPEEIRQFNREIIRFLVDQGCKLVVVACNTSAAWAFRAMQQEFTVPMVEVLSPGAKAAVAATQSGRVGVWATEATVRSGAYARAVKAQRPDAEVVQVACPLLVPLVEGGRVASAEAKEAVAHYLEPIRRAGADTLILGCTHYPFLTPSIQESLGEGVAVVNPAEETARRAGEVLENLGLSASRRQADRFCTSGEAGIFQRLGSILAGRPLERVEQVTFSSPLGVIG